MATTKFQKKGDFRGHGDVAGSDKSHKSHESTKYKRNQLQKNNRHDGSITNDSAMQIGNLPYPLLREHMWPNLVRRYQRSGAGGSLGELKQKNLEARVFKKTRNRWGVIRVADSGRHQGEGAMLPNYRAARVNHVGMSRLVTISPY